MKKLGLIAALIVAAGSWTGARAAEDPVSAPMIRRGPSTSTNWSGYAVTGPAGSVTDAKGSWIVPAVTCTAATTYSSFWVGIDGYNSGTVEQTGTDSDCVSGKPQYYAWYEFYPKKSRSSIKVNPGDKITAEITGTAKGGFKVTLTDVTSGQSFSETGKVAQAQGSSAEWIAEAPSSGGILPLANFGTVSFGMDATAAANTCTATVGKATGPISTFGAAVQSITMVTSSGATKASISPLSPDGTSFSVQWVNSGS